MALIGGCSADDDCDVTLKGEVVRVEPLLNFFEIVGKRRDKCRVYSVAEVLPVQGDVVTIKNPKKGENFFLIFPETDYEFPQTTNVNKEEGLWARLLKLPPVEGFYEEFQFIDKFIKQFTRHSPDTIAKCLRVFYKDHYVRMAITYCLQKRISVPGDLCKTNASSEAYKAFVKFPEGFVIQQYPSQYALVGHMIIGRNHSNMILRDDSFWVFVKFLDGPVDLDLYDNCMIIIWRYTLVVEIYEDKDRPSLSYILVAERDVTRMIRSYDKRNLRYLSYRHRLHCSKRMRYEIIVSKRSQTIVGYDSTAQCWLEVRLKQSNDRWIMCYLIMPKELVGAASFLKEDHCYRIYSDAPMKRDKVYFFKELRIQGNPNQELRLLDPRSVIQEIEFPEDAPLHLSRYHAATFDELELFMRRTDHKFMFDLTAKIHRRVIVPNNLSPWCPRRHFREPYFGTGSSLQEKLTFKGDDASRWPIDLYLCNQENQVCHFGLLPGATVLITNVLSQKSRYLRTTVFTRVEVLEYPRPIYSSAHLVFEDFDSWVWHRQLRTAGPDLHVFSKILANSVVYSPVLVRHISSFKLNGGAHTFKMILEVQQERNTFLIESLDIFLLADLLGITGTNPAGARARKCLRSYCEVKPYKIFPQVAFDAKRPLHAKVIEPGRVFKDLISLITKFINYDLNPLMEVVLLRQAPDQEVPYRVMSCASSLEFSEF